MSGGYDAYIDIIYSDERRKEMTQYNEKNCYITKSLVENEIKMKFNINVESTYMPREKDRVIDISFKIRVDSAATLEKIEQMVRSTLGKSAKAVKSYINDIEEPLTC